MSVTATNSRIGQPVRRKEDLRLLAGQGLFSDDVHRPGEAYAVFLRSPHAHALIRSINTGRALSQTGVLAVLTGSDVLADGLKPLPHKPDSLIPANPQIPSRDGSRAFSAPQYALAI